MENKNLFQRIEGMPIGVVATAVGAATLSNVYQMMGYQWIRHITMIGAFLVLISAIIKITAHFNTFKSEYSNVVPCSLYATVTMLTMILSSYVFAYNASIGKAMWFIAVILHTLHILIFTFNNVIRGVKLDTFGPSWFVTYNGLLVSTVIGVPMQQPALCRAIVIYGIIIFALIIPFMLVRMVKKPVIGPILHTRAILIAPPSLCIVGYLNFFENPNKNLLYILYVAVLAAVIFTIYNLTKFFALGFNPGVASLTFPMAIGIVASTKMSGYLINNGQESLGNIIKEIQGIQVYLATAIIAFVIFNFIKIFKKKA